VGCDAVVCARLLPLSSYTARIPVRRAAAVALNSPSCCASVAQCRIQQIQERAIDITIHFDQHFEAFVRVGGSVFLDTDVPLIQSQDGTHICRLTFQVDFWKTLQSALFLRSEAIFFVFIMGQQKMYTIEMG
jgi:hypothetical protein